MHAQQTIEKNIKQLQEDTYKKHPDISKECSQALQQLTNTKTEKSDQVSLAIQFAPFIYALKSTYKPPAYVYESVYYLIVNNKLEENNIKMLITLLIKHLNEHRDNGIRIIQCFCPLLYYDCVYGELLKNVFYCFINAVNSQNQMLAMNAKGMCNQIVANIFTRYKKTKEKVYYNDCKNLLSDIYEYMNNEKFISIPLTLDFIDCAINNSDIFVDSENKEMFMKIIDKMNKYKKELKVDETKDIEKINKITYKILKEKHFGDYGLSLLKSCEDIVSLFDEGFFTIVISDENTKKEFFSLIERFLCNQLIETSAKLNFFIKIKNFLKLIEEGESFSKNQNIENENLGNQTHNYSLDNNSFYVSDLQNFFVYNFYDYIKNVPVEDAEDTKQIFSFILPRIIGNKELFKKYISFMIKINETYANLCIKICMSIKEEIRDEWSIILRHIESKNEYTDTINSIIEESLKFNGDELFYLFCAIENKNTLVCLFMKNLERMTFHLDSVVVVFLFAYNDTNLLCTLIGDYYKKINECDFGIEVLPFIFLKGKLLGFNINNIMNKNQDNICFKEFLEHHNNINFNKCNDENIYVQNCEQEQKNTAFTKHEISINEQIQIINLILSILRTMGEKINHCWDILIEILEITVCDKELAEINFKILQMIFEDLFFLLTENNKERIIRLLDNLNKYNNNLNLTLQILSVLGDLSKQNNAINSLLLFVNYNNCILNIIKREQIGWNDVFDTGTGLLFGFKKEDVKNDKKAFIYENCIPEVLALLKDVFYRKLNDEKDINYEEKKRNKESLIYGLSKINEYINEDALEYKNFINLYERNVEATNNIFDKQINNDKCNNIIGSEHINDNYEYKFVKEEYFKFLDSIICYGYNIEQRSVDKWKNEIAIECLKGFNSYFFVNHNTIYFNILKNIQKKTEIDEKLYYDKEIYIGIINLTRQLIFCAEEEITLLDSLESFYLFTDEDIRISIFDLFRVIRNQNKVFQLFIIWLKFEDRNLIDKILDYVNNMLRTKNLVLTSDENDIEDLVANKYDVTSIKKYNHDKNSVTMLFNNNVIEKKVKPEDEAIKSSNYTIKFVNHTDDISDHINSKDINITVKDKNNLNDTDENKQCYINNNVNENILSGSILKSNNKNDKMMIYSFNDNIFVNKEIIKSIYLSFVSTYKYDDFYFKALECIKGIGIQFKENLEMVKYFLRISKFICLEEDINKNQYSNLITFYGATNQTAKKSDPLLERKKEKVLMEFIDCYINITSLHLLQKESIYLEAHKSISNYNSAKISDNIKDNNIKDNDHYITKNIKDNGIKINTFNNTMRLNDTKNVAILNNVNDTRNINDTKNIKNNSIKNYNFNDTMSLNDTKNVAILENDTIIPNEAVMANDTRNTNVLKNEAIIVFDPELNNEIMDLVTKDNYKSFQEEVFTLILILSRVKGNSYRENLSFKSLEYLFIYHDFTKKLLVERIRLSLNEFIKEINIFKDLYPRIKKKEIYFIFERLVNNPSLVKEVKNELIECLSTRDFYVIEKVKE
ncbi:hypothetical protein COBT_001232, partial [Conglomerata obtusa]